MVNVTISDTKNKNSVIRMFYPVTFLWLSQVTTLLYKIVIFLIFKCQYIVSINT
jgi:hypothetical protein